MQYRSHDNTVNQCETTEVLLSLHSHKTLTVSLHAPAVSLLPLRVLPVAIVVPQCCCLGSMATALISMSRLGCGSCLTATVVLTGPLAALGKYWLYTAL